MNILINESSSALYTVSLFLLRMPHTYTVCVLVLQIVTFGRTPYHGMSGRDVVHQVAKGYRMPRPEGDGIACNDALYQMMLKCWSARPEDRPTFQYLKEFFDSFAAQSEGCYGGPPVWPPLMGSSLERVGPLYTHAHIDIRVLIHNRL